MKNALRALVKFFLTNSEVYYINGELTASFNFKPLLK